MNLTPNHKDSSAVSLPSPSAMALSNPNSLEFLSAAELASLAAGSPLRKRHFTALLLERFSSPIFFYLLSLLFCRMFILKDRNFFRVVITPVLFILSAYLTTFATRHMCEGFRVPWVQVLAAFGPSLILVILMASGRFWNPRKKIKLFPKLFPNFFPPAIDTFLRMRYNPNY